MGTERAMTLTMSELDEIWQRALHPLRMEVRPGDVLRLIAAARRSIDMDQRLCDLGVDPDHILPPPPSMASEVVPEGEPTPGIKSEPSGHRFKNGLEPLAPPPLESGTADMREVFPQLEPLADFLDGSPPTSDVAEWPTSDDGKCPYTSNVADLCARLRLASHKAGFSESDCHEAAAMLERQEREYARLSIVADHNTQAALEQRVQLSEKEREIERLKQTIGFAEWREEALAHKLEATKRQSVDLVFHEQNLSEKEREIERLRSRLKEVGDKNIAAGERARAALKGDRT